MNKPNQRNGTKSKRTQKKKNSIIAVVAIGALLILLLLILFGRQFVGQAITPEVSALGQAGIFLTGNTVGAGDSFIIPVKVNIGEDTTNALGFVLNHPGLVLDGSCTDAVIIDLPRGWITGLTVIDCAEEQIVFSGGTVNPEDILTGEFSVASIKFQGASAGVYNLVFPTFDVIDFETETNLITEKVNKKMVAINLPPLPGK